MINYTINLDKARALQAVGCEPAKRVDLTRIGDLRAFLRNPARLSLSPGVAVGGEPTIWHVLHAVFFSDAQGPERRAALKGGLPSYSTPQIMLDVGRGRLTDETFEQALAYLAAEGYIAPVKKAKLKVPKTVADIPAGGLTKAQFDRLMVRGWKEHKKGWVPKVFSNTQNSYCAFGVVASELGAGWCPSLYERDRILPQEIRVKIYQASDDARSKADAIRRVKALEW